MKIATKITLSSFLTGVILTLLIIFALYLAGTEEVRIALREYFFILILLMPIIALIGGFYAAKLVSDPINRLREGTEIVRSGVLSHRVGIGATDEIGDISRVFDKVTGDLERMTLTAQKYSKELFEREEDVKVFKEKVDYFSSLFESSSNAMFVYDVTGRIYDVNKKASGLSGYDKESLLKMNIHDLHTESELRRSKETLRTGVEMAPVCFESQFRKANGSVIDVEISTSIVSREKSLMEASVSDVTEKKKLERALKDSGETFRTFMETASDLMYIADAKGSLTYANEAMLRALGYSRDELIGKPISGLVSKKSLKEHLEQEKLLVSMGTTAYEPVWTAKNGKEIIGEITIVAVYDRRGNVVESQGIFRDVTERKKIENSQRLAKLGELISDMAHEVNNPLQVILGWAQLALMDQPKDSHLSNTLNIIVNECLQAKNIIQRLLMFSKPSKGNLEEMDLNKAIDFVTSLVEHQLSLVNVRIVKKYSSLPVTAKVDSKQMEEVFMNLIKNAADAMPEGGTITIATARDNGKSRIEITDTGIGIPEENMEKIFEPFFTTKENGSGLGLAVSFGIVRAHGGELKYKSKVGEGTTVAIVLPAALEVA